MGAVYGSLNETGKLSQGSGVSEYCPPGNRPSQRSVRGDGVNWCVCGSLGGRELSKMKRSEEETDLEWQCLSASMPGSQWVGGCLLCCSLLARLVAGLYRQQETISYGCYHSCCCGDCHASHPQHPERGRERERER